MEFWRPTRKITAFGLWAFAGLLAGVIAYGTADRTKIVTEEMVIIPGVFQSESWSSGQESLISDLSENALFEDFNPQNAAYIDSEFYRSQPVVPSDSSNEESSSTPEDVPSPALPDDSIGSSTVVEPVISTESTPVIEAASPQSDSSGLGEPIPQLEPEPIPDSSPAESGSTPDITSWNFLPVTEKYPYVQAVITNNVTTTESMLVADSETETNSTTPVEVSEVSDQLDVSSADRGDLADLDTSEETLNPAEEIVADVTEEVQQEILTVPVEESLDSDDTVELVADSEVEVEKVFSPLDACEGYADCAMYPATWSGFVVPEFESGNFLSDVSLRLSLGAQAQNDNGPQQFVVEYRYEVEGSWRVATVIDIEDEISNSINGGYYLVALDKPLSQAQISALEVRVSYLGSITALDRAYIEAVWLEITSASFYEESDDYYGMDSLRGESVLIDPRFHEMITEPRDLTAETLPQFTMSYSPQQNILRRLATALFSENTYAVETVRVVDAQGVLVDIPLKVAYIDETTWSIEFKKQPQKFLPGKYLVEVVVNENETRYIDSFEFYWGVLAVNTTKGRYYPSDEVVLNLAALTDKGDTICDAILDLRITTPNNEFFDVPVDQSGFCGKNNVTDMPDYVAIFKETSTIGRYTIQLQHRNVEGEIVHRIENHFEVADFIPYEIERTAPTRIYPPAPYTVSLKVKANRSFEGDVVERVPRGFVITEMGDALIETNSDHTAIVWRDVTMEAGEEMILSYRFDAPDISPYLYLLGPLSLDGYEELRPWQIASDAITAVGWLTGTRTVAGTNLNQAASPLQWSTSSLDTFYFGHSTSTNSHEVTIRQAGDYFLAVNLPQQRTDANTRGTRIGLQVRVNGVIVPGGLGRSGYISNQTGHNESSSHLFFMLNDVAVDDVVTIDAEGLTTINVADIVNVTGSASLYLEYLSNDVGVFAATTTRTVNSVNLNQTTEYAFQWIESRQDTGFVHSDSVNSENIILSDPGVYHVQANIPLTSDSNNTNILGQVRLDGALVSGGQFKQGFGQAPGTESDPDSSIHFSGIVVSTTTNQVLTLTALREGNAGTVLIATTTPGSVYVRKLPSADLIALRGTAVVGGTNWNPAAASSVQWTLQDAKDATIFTHSTTSNSHQITIATNGDYYLSYNDALQNGVTRANSRVQVLKNGVAVSGAQTKSHYIRNQNAHTESSAALVFILEGLINGDIITITTQQEGAAGTLDDSTAATLLLWKKQTFNQRPDAPTMYNAPFDNIRFASTTPYFDFSAVDPDGSQDIEYQFSISTSSDFGASSTYSSAVDSEFFNTASSTDVSPYVEGNRIRFQLTAGDALTDLVTYYWRVRAKDVSGSGEFGDWSTTQSLTVDLAQTAPSWYQSYSGQFEGDTLVGTVSSGNDKVQVDASPSSEILLVYGEGTVTTPRYRFWNGTSWGTATSAQAVGGTINWVATAAGVTRNEYVLGTVDASSQTYAQIYSASTTSWGNLALLQSGITGPAYRGIAVGYESISGDAMAVSCSNGPNLVYRTWNGTTWSATSTIVVSSLNNCNFVQLASDPSSDEIIIVTRDTGTQYQAFVWDGNAWIESRVIGASALVAREGIAIAYESSGDQAVIVVSNNTNNNIAYTTWNGTEFSTNATQAIGNDFAYGQIAVDPDSDELLLCYVDADSDFGVLRWNGGVWTGTFSELDTVANSSTARPFECNFETVSGRGDTEIAVYSDTTNVRYRTATSTTWATELSVDTAEDSFWVQAERAGDGTIVMVSLDDAADILVTSRWNGAGWSTRSTLETNLSSTIAAPYEMYDMVAKRFQFSEGVVTTPPIDFTAVPNQPTWGDISFDTEEPFGTDVQVRVRYSSSTVCDVYVSDIALPGNSSGFDVTDVPINLTGLSTSTYDQICLEATVTTLGSQSAALEEWTLSWVRQPKLNQSNYRWYVNGSFLTPTDPWPLGIEDLAENTVLTSVTAISADETIRLRLAVEGVNVTLPAFSEAFKLQYAEGLTCGASLTWRDVGNAASTTALWRGYENAIVGDDWLSGSWTKRIRLTVPTTVVEGSLTDFPVYVNLANLPNSFFSSVQSDGDDIRITRSDGVTEVPYELVTIDTSVRSGELYFRAHSLSTTTNTSFYIYYGNPSASGYAVTATYGRNNVWSNGFLAVYHLDQSAAATAPQFVDSTGNSQGTAQNMEAGDRLAGIVGRYQNIDGTNEFIDLGATFNRSILRSTWQIWASSSVTQGAYDGLLMSRATGETSGINISSVTSRLGYHWRDAANTWSWTGGPTYATSGQPFMVSLLIEPTQAVLWRHAGSGIASATNAVAHATGSITALDIGQDPLGGRLFAGGIDEMSMSNVVRSTGWLNTTFNNRSNPTGFYTLSTEELINDGRRLPSTLLSNSNFSETYEEENPTLVNQNSLPVNDESEWDFVLQNNGALPNTNYCFRLVYEDGSQFNSYTNYPRLLTNAPPLSPVNAAPFDNERLASTSPWFEFAADDELDDEVAYQIQVSTDYNFSSALIDSDSVTNFALFTNLSQPSQKSTFTPGETIQFIPTVALSNNTTYWWRVRAIDPLGSNTYGSWSNPTSFTVNTATVITTWFQTTGNQFLTNNLLDATSSLASNDVGIDAGFTAATTTSTVIDYDDRDTGNAWGQFSFTDNVTSGSIDYYIEYRVSGETFALIPDSVLPGNSGGFNTSPVSLVALDTALYNELRITAVLVGNATLPRLQDWTVTWSETIDVPTLEDPFDNAKVGTTTPSFLFYTSDPENNDLQYELQLSSTYSFVSSSTFLSGVDAGFINTEIATDTSPFFTDDVIRYTTQSALSNGSTYWWRVRARDPGGSNTWSRYSEPESFTVDTAITTSVWHQTTGEQFDTNALVDIETVAGGAQITSTINEVMTVYGEGTGQAPQYKLWNGTAWSTAASAQSVGAQISWLELKASPVRPEYALATLGTDLDVNVQIYDGDNGTWGNVREIEDNSGASNKRGFNIAYESLSGDLMAVACDGTEAAYAIWNGTSWTATSSLALTNPNNCEYIAIASDPVSDEIIAVFRHTNTDTTDYEALVWTGSGWGSSIQLGNIDLNTNEGMAVGYEESGNQAIVAVSNNALTTLLFTTWNGSSWATISSTTLGDRIEWARLKSDVGTDRMALCYQDNDIDVGVIFWDGAAWGTFSELDIDGNADNGRAIDCEFETEGARDGYLMVGYSDTIGTRYQSYATTTPSGEVTLDTITDATEVQMVRSGSGLLLLSAYDDALTPDRIDHSRWNGTNWSTRESFTTNASLNASGIYNGGSSMAPQLYPNFTSGSIRSTAIDFADGTGPRWDFVSWNDTTPGASAIEYRVYYESAPGVFTLIPDSDLPGNAAGFTTSPIDISGVNRVIYSVLQLDAQLSCDSGDCPSVQDWSVAWSEGVTVSGIAREYDEVSTTTSGTVAVAVNGVLQAGKTGIILGDGTWSINNVTVFPNDTVTVFVDGAADANEAVAIATYNGVGNMTGLELTKRHVTLGSASAATTTNANFAGYDNADDEDIFFTIGGSNLFTLCVESSCADAILTVKSGTQYLPGANTTLVTLKNFGVFSPATNTVRINGIWNNQGTFNEDTSTVIFTATTSSSTLVTATSTFRFHNVTFGETTGSSTWLITKPVTVAGNLAINFGTLARGTSTLDLRGNLSIGVSGALSGLATTTFAGTGSHTWSDAKPSASSSNVGNVVIDGTAKTITLAGNVGAESVVIGTDDTLNSSGSGYNITVYQNWVNNNSFVAQNGTVSFVGTSTGLTIQGSSAFNNLTFGGVGGSWSFATSTLLVNGDLTIATGTVTLPTGTTTIAGSFNNTGGTFLHNNGEVRMTSTAGGRTITQRGTAFLNAFYDLVFTGSGSWSFTEVNATTSRDFRIQSGSVTFPSGQLSVGGDLNVTGSGSFAHNNGEVVLLVQAADFIRTNGSVLNNVRVRGSSGSSWYNSSWSSRVPVVVKSTQVGASVTDFPVYVNLANLPAAFFSGIQATGADIRVTTGNGFTEVPYELVSLNTGLLSGELHFKAPSISTTTDTTFYIYFGNSTANAYSATSTFGRNNVWTNGYLAVYHLDESPTATAPQYVSSNGVSTGTSNNMESGDRQAAQLGNGQVLDGTNEFIQTTFNTSISTSTWSVWMRANGAQGAYDGVVFSRGTTNTTGLGFNSGGNRLGYHWNDAGATFNWNGGPVAPLNEWFMASLVVLPNTATMYLHASSGHASGTNATTHASSLINDLKFGQDDAGGRFFNGSIDEVRLSNVARSEGWLLTEYNNHASTTRFYTTGGVESSFTRAFTDTSATILGNFVADAGGDSIFPTGVLSVGGSFTNGALFNANNGTVRFNSTAGSETVTAGSSSFATLEFNSGSGIFTVTGNATATTAINLTNASSFTVASGTVLSSAGTFTNALLASSTTWTGSTLRLVSGTSVTLNAKTHGGDTYGTLAVASGTVARLWNSSSSVYSPTGSSSAIYSQDHAGIDGDLFIFGDYRRATGTEHWSYATDFDGTALGTSSERQVDVRIAANATTTISNGATLSIIGAPAASTTIDAQSGAYGMVLNTAVLNAEYFSLTNTATSGLQLLASTSINVFKDGSVAVVPGRTGMTIDGSTVNTNPSEQYLNFRFATTSAGLGTNVTLSGTSTNFIWFRSGAGALYGEAFDANDVDPGALRFDDSSYIITVSGVVYSDDGVTPMGTSTCDGVTPNVRIVVAGGLYSNAVSCAIGTAAYTFTNVAYIGDPAVIVYLNTNGGQRGSVVTKTPTTNISNMNVYANRVIVRHEDTAPLTITDMAPFDSSDDSDIAFTVATGSPNTLVTSQNTELYIWGGKSFAPAGNISLLGNGNSNGYEGTLALGSGSNFVATGTETHTLSGRLVLGSGATFTPASSTVIFNATTTGKSLTSTSTITFNNVRFAGIGGGWNIGAALTILGNMEVASGTVTGTGNITVTNGLLYGNGVLSLGGGTTTLSRTNTLGGSTPWTFFNLQLGNGTVVGTTTPAGNATTTILGSLTIANAHFLAAGSSVWDLAGTGTVFLENGTFLEDSSTIRYSGAGANVRGTNYYNLVAEAGVGSATYTTAGSGFMVLNNLIIGGAASSTLTFNVNDPIIEVVGTVSIGVNGTLEASNSSNLSVRGNWQNDGRFTHSNGVVRFIGSTTTDIAAGNSSFATVEIDGSGSTVVSEHATATVAWRLINHDTFTVQSGQSLAVGGDFLNNLAGADTIWTGSNLVLFGLGTYEINDAATADTYETLTVASGTQVRMWNSSATTYRIASSSSLYSQDHAGVNGDLYIYGQLNRTSGDDFWSFDIDFDGTDLSGGSERQANVYFASGASALWSGGSLSVIGTSSASTTISNQGSGTYALTVGGTATTDWSNVVIRDTNSSGVTFTGTPTVTDFSYTDHLVEINNGSAVSVTGTVIDSNPARNFTNNLFAESGGVTTPKNVTASGSSVSSWRFTNHSGNIDGEAFDSDPAGDPGYVVWDDSSALITVAGTVYSDEGVTVSGVCDGVTNNVRLVVAGLTTYNTSCNATTGAFSIANVAFNTLDTLTLYLNGETERAATVSVAPVSSISNMHLYENRVIVRHEGTNPITIADMAVWDSSDDADIPFTAVDAGSDTVSLPADYKLLVWTGKTFAPGGNVTVSGGGAGAAYDGTLEVQSNAIFRAAGTQSHAVGGSFIFGTGAQFVSASSTITLTTTGAARTIDVNANSFHNLTVSGVGSWTITDPTLQILGSYLQSAGALTLPTGTTTVGAAFAVNGGSVSGTSTPFVFTTSGAGTTVRFNGATIGALTFVGSGSWNMTDTNATTSGSVTVSRGTVSLPSGSLSVAGNFRNTGGAITHNTSDLIMRATTTASVLASSSDLFAVRFVGGGSYTLQDTSVTLLDSLEIASGSVTIGTGTLAVGGSFTATGGSFTHASGTVLLNATAGGRTVNPGVSSFYNLQVGAPAGSYTFNSATTTNNFTIASVSSLTVNSGSTITVSGVFLNSVGGAATTWTGSTLRLLGQSAYSLNSRTNNGDVYGTLVLGPNVDVRMWNSSAATTTVDGSSSLYSQDHNNVNGDLTIYGDLVIATTTEHWSYTTDFDGTSLSGSERAVNVYFAPNATTTVVSGVLNIIGTSLNQTDITNQSTSSTHALAVSGGTLNADWYTMARLNILGLQLSGLSTVSNLANGSFTLAVNGGSLITISSTTLNANPSKVFDNVGFATTTAITGFNVNLVGETGNAWRFTNSYGNLSGEAFDIDGVDACGSVRFDNSACLLTEQTHVRWRANNGGEGAPDSEWYDLNWDLRKRVRVLNNDNQAYASTAVKVTVAYETEMQADFDDLRFTRDDGVTPVPFWVERYTASTDAQIWVWVPTLPASDHTTVFMYYGNNSASSTSSGTSTFGAFDDYEDASISEYSGDTSLFTTVTSPVYGGSRALGGNPVSGKTTDGIFRFDQTVARGNMIRYLQYVNAGVAGNNDEPCVLFGVQSPGTTNQNYAVCLERFGVDRISLAKDVQNNDVSGTLLATTTVTFSTGWYEVEIDWRTTNQILVSLYNSAGSLVATTSATDSTYSSGGYGFAYWYQNGAWDSFTARPRVATRPTIYFGAEQVPGGASWLAAQDAVGSTLPNTVVRLRVAIENSGLDITGQQFRLEYAAKAGAPTCESVSGGSYASVPNQVSCGTSPVCMATSSVITNGQSTTDLLFGTNGTFSAGKVVISPDSQTTALDVDQDYYTEIEYAVVPTVYASDAYCLRVTNAGTELDFYGTVAELGLQFDPQLSSVSLNEGLDISLTPGTTTTVIASTTVTDFNGYTDLTHATATIYRSGAGALCTPDNNNCYVLSTENGLCAFTSCSGNSCTLQCTAEIAFHADPTDVGSSYEGQAWLAYMEVEDASAGYDFESSPAPGVELYTLRALQVDSLINYGALEADSDTGSNNASTTVTNFGNVEINIDVEATDLSDGGTSVIPAEQQKMSTSTFTYSACVSCYQLSSSSAVTLGINLSKPSTIVPPVETDVYWGIAVPFGINSAPHSGVTIFTPIGVN